MSPKEKCYVPGCDGRVVAKVRLNEKSGLVPVCELHDPGDFA